MTKNVTEANVKTKRDPTKEFSNLSLVRIEPIRQARLRRFLFLSPWLMLAAVPLILWPSNPLHIPGQYFFSIAFVTATLALFAFRFLMLRIADIFEILWRRRVIAYAGQAKTEPATSQKNRKDPKAVEQDVLYEQYRSFAKGTENLLNSWGQWVVAAICVIIVMTWFLYAFTIPEIAQTPILLVGILAEVTIASVIGLMAWRMIIIGIRVWHLPERFELAIQEGHPDHCGGLEPLGNVCLWNALIIAMAGLFLGGWLAIGPLTTERDTALFYAPIYRPLLVVPIGLSFINFFLPLWSIHRIMVTKKAEIQHRLEELAQSIYQEDRELLHSADNWIRLKERTA
jgi:hypothetical protein